MKRLTVELLARLDEQGREQLGRGQWAQAAQTFGKMLELEDHPVVRNNLATAFYNGGWPEEAWRIMEPVLAKGAISPFAWALASMIAWDLGWEEAAREYLQKAISLFEGGAHSPRELGFEPAGWREYTVIIKRAAGHLGQDPLVVDLHNRWERYYQTPEDFFQAGVAFFNLHDPRKAAQVWSQVQDRGWGFLQAYITVARLVDQGVVPGFTLPYSAPSFPDETEFTEESVHQTLSHGGNRAVVLANLFDPGFPKEMAQQAVPMLVSLGEWGTAFGQALLRSGAVAKDLKVAAGFALLEKGVIRPGEPVIMVIDGMEQEVYLDRWEM